MIRTTIASLFAAIALCSSSSLLSQDDSAATAEKLLRTLWDSMKAGDMEGIGKTMAPGFQSVHQDGSMGSEGELALIKGLKIESYSLSDVKASECGSTIVISYKVSVEESIGGKRLSKKPAPRLSVFVKTEEGWKWLAHANLKSLDDLKK